METPSPLVESPEKRRQPQGGHESPAGYERLTVMVNVVTAYARVTFATTPHSLSVEWPVAILGVLPVRTDRLDVARKDLRSLRLVPVFFPGRLVVALFLATLLWAAGPPAPAGFLLGAGTVFFVLLSYVAAVRIDHTTGTTFVPVCWLQRRKTAAFIASVCSPGEDHERARAR